MDGIHDLGGREGFGPIDVGEDETPFHAPWEARMLGLVRAMTRAPDWNLDWFRHCRELIDPAQYLTRGYYDQWLTTYGAMMVNSGWATVGEIASGRCAAALADISPPLPAEAVSAKSGMVSFARPATATPRFGVGQEVRTRAHGHSGHTRLPAYARGKPGRVERYHGFHVLPDANAFGDPRAEPLYTVAFDRAALWPEPMANRCAVHLDLWESYLE